MRDFCLVAATLVLWAPATLAGPDREEGRDILEKYFAASQAQSSQLRGVRMEVDIEASLPRLKKEGRMHAMRFITRLGVIAYRGVLFMGDGTIKKDVIARYLTAETQPQGMNIGISDDNYKFKYRGLREEDGRTVHVFQLQPRRKAVGLFKGELWVDPETYMPVQESGQLVRSPSVFLKKVEFVRQYEIRDGLAIPKHIESRVDARVVGKAQLAIEYSNFSRVLPEDEPSDVATGDSSNPTPHGQ